MLYKFIARCFVIAAVCWHISATAQSVAFSPDPVHVSPKDTFWVSAIGVGFDSLSGFSMLAQWDTSLLTLISIADGDFDLDNSNNNYLSWVSATGLNFWVKDTAVLAKFTFCPKNNLADTTTYLSFAGAAGARFYKNAGLDPKRITGVSSDTGLVIVRQCASAWFWDTPPGDTALCSGQTALVGVADTFPGWHYQWGTGKTTPRIEVSTAGTYTLIITNSQGCSLADTITVNANSLSVPPMQDTAFCLGKPLAVGPKNPLPDWRFRWSNDSTTATIMVGAAGTYTLTVTNAAGCQAVMEQKVTERIPEGQVASKEVHIVRSDSVLFIVQDAVAYVWSTGSKNDSLKVSPPEDAVYYVTITDANGCVHTDSVSVIVLNGRQINMFTPNDDGINDVLIFDEILNTSNVILSNTRLTVWDNWGNSVYDHTNYQNDWNGCRNDNNGTPLPQDTYFFSLRYGRPVQSKYGTITILR